MKAGEKRDILSGSVEAAIPEGIRFSNVAHECDSSTRLLKAVADA